MMVMGDIKQIWQREQDNNNFIHLYKIDNYWFAFERSAFYLFSTSSVDTVLKVQYLKGDSAILFAALKDVNRMKSNNPYLDIIQESESEIIVGCAVRCKGFSLWKNSLTTIMPSNLYAQTRNLYHSIKTLYPVVDL